MAYPTGMDSFDKYLATMYKRQGMNPSISASAPATRQSLPQPNAPRGSLQGPVSSVGQSLMNTVGTQVANRGTNMLMNALMKYMAGNAATGATGGLGALEGNALGMGGTAGLGAMGGGMDMASGLGAAGGGWGDIVGAVGAF